MLKIIRTPLAMLLLLCAELGHSQTFINGSFEVTTATMACNYNLNNGLFNSLMSDNIAYGGGNETDILINGCYTTGIPDGIRAIGIAGATTDEVSLPLTIPLTPGESYTISFYTYSEITFRVRGDVEIGASTSPLAFGTAIFTAATVEETWVYHEFTFIAAEASTHITVRNVAGPIHWNHVDNFVMIEEEDELDVVPTHPTCFEACDGIAEVTPGVLGPYTYLWDPTAGGGTGISATDLCAGTYTVEVTDGTGLVTELEVTIIDPEEIVGGIIDQTNLACFGDADGSVIVAATGGTGALTYDIGDGPVDPGEFVDLTGGAYIVTVIDENGCTLVVPITIIEPLPIVVDNLITGESCEGDCTGTIWLDPSGGVGPYTYSIDDCLSIELDGAFSDLCAGDYDICIEDANGCRYTEVLTVALGLPLVIADISAIDPLCVGDAAVTIDAVDLGVLTGLGIVGDSFDPSVAGPGTHTITNTITEGCGGVGTIDIIVNPLPNVIFMTIDDDGCIPVDVNFTSIGDPGVTCMWEFGDGSFSTDCGIADHTYDVPGAYDVTLTLTDANGCIASATYIDYVRAFELPEANFDFAPRVMTTLDTEVDFTDLSTGADGWNWTFDVYGNSSDQNPTFVFPSQAGNYQVTLDVTTVNGCTDQITKVVVINEEPLIYVPNTITPDGDPFNQQFLPYFTGIDIYDYHLVLYNRWGEVLFESFDLTKGWDGTFGGEIVPNGVYIWHITTADIATDKKLEYHGHVTVLR